MLKLCILFFVVYFPNAYILISEQISMLWLFVGIVLSRGFQWMVITYNSIEIIAETLDVLYVSCLSANKFLAILFLLFARSSSNSPRSFQRFRRTLRQNFNWIRFDNSQKTFPIDPHYKNCPRSATYNFFLQWGSMGKFFTRCRIWMKFCTRVRLKPSHDQEEFELDRASSKNNIAKNLFALGHETHNTQYL